MSNLQDNKSVINVSVLDRKILALILRNRNLRLIICSSLLMKIQTKLEKRLCDLLYRILADD